MGPPPWMTWFATVSWLGFRSSRFGPTLPLEPAAFSVWQPPHPAEAKTCLPAAASPFPVGAAAVVVGADAVDAVCPGSEPLRVSVCTGDSPATSGLSLPKTSTAEIIATKNSTHNATYQPMCLPGKFGLRRGRTKAETSAKTMKAPPTTIRPILLPVDRPATTGASVESIGGGTYRN